MHELQFIDEIVLLSSKVDSNNRKYCLYEPIYKSIVYNSDFIFFVLIYDSFNICNSRVFNGRLIYSFNSSNSSNVRFFSVLFLKISLLLGNSGKYTLFNFKE